MRNLTLDILKIVLAMMVVGLHTLFWSDQDAQLARFLNSYLFRIAVPIFFIINGYFAFRAIQEPKRFFNWFWRIMALYGVWALIYAPLYVPHLKTIKDWALQIGIGYFHLWYLPATAVAGLLVYWLRDAPRAVRLGLMALCYSIGLGLQYLGNYHVFAGSPLDAQLQYYPIYRNTLFFAFPLFGLGYDLAKSCMAERTKPIFAGLIALMGLGLMVGEFALNVTQGVNEGFDILVCLPVVAVGVFILAIALKTKVTTSNSDQHWPNALSSVIYLCHPMVLYGLKHLGQSDDFWRQQSLMGPVAILICVVLTPVLMAINKRFFVSIL